MEHLPHLLAAYGVFLLGVMTPGPNWAAVAGASMARSRRSGLGVATGVSIGTVGWSSLSVLGLTLLLSAHADLALVLRIAGGGYLLWLGLQSLRAALRGAGALPVPTRDAGLPWTGAVLRGLAVQATNPKTALFWLSIMSLVLTPGAPAWVGGAVILGTTAISLAWYSLMALAFSTSRATALYARARRAVEAVLGVYFCLLGGRLVLGQ